MGDAEGNGKEKFARPPIHILEGDHFDIANIDELTHKMDAVWDRGSMVALPPHSWPE